MAGRHRKPSRLSDLRMWWLLLCAAGVAACVVVVSAADDVRVLRATALSGLFLAALSVFRLASARRPAAGLDDEVRQLRAEVARLAAVMKVVAMAPASSPVSLPPERTTMLSLPLVRAALQVPVQSANGHNHVVDVTDAALGQRD